jgi:hypothetical protein
VIGFFQWSARAPHTLSTIPPLYSSARLPCAPPFEPVRVQEYTARERSTKTACDIPILANHMLVR